MGPHVMKDELLGYFGVLCKYLTISRIFVEFFSKNGTLLFSIKYLLPQKKHF